MIPSHWNKVLEEGYFGKQHRTINGHSLRADLSFNYDSISAPCDTLFDEP